MTKQNNFFKQQDGVALYFAVVVLAALTGIVLGLASLIVGQIQVIRGVENSVIAFAAAEAGVERELFEGNTPPYNTTGTLGNASYEYWVTADGASGCVALLVCIRSVGTFEEASRAIFLNL